MSDLPLQTPDALRPLAQQCERQRYSPLTEPALLLDLNASASSDALFQDWLRTLPAPVIGVGPTDAVLAAACDAVLATADAAVPQIGRASGRERVWQAV